MRNSSSRSDLSKAGQAQPASATFAGYETQNESGALAARQYGPVLPAHKLRLFRWRRQQLCRLWLDLGAGHGQS